MAKEKKKVPALRFKAFTNDWEQRKLGEVVERFDNLRIPVTSSKREKGITPYYGANGIQDYVQGYTHDGEFVLVAEDGANDLQNYPVHYVNGKVWVNNHAHVLQGKNKMVDNLFLVNAIKQIKIETYLVGGSRAKLNADVMMKLPIKVPTFNEQQKIGEYFSKFDTLITLHQRKLVLLKQLKKGLLQKMFAEKDSKRPVLRFKGFHDDWEQRKLGEVYGKIENAFVGTVTPYYVGKENGHFYLESNNVKDGYINRNNEIFINDEFYKKQRNKWLHTGDIVMVQSGHVGHSAVIPKELNNIAAHALIMFRYPVEKVEPNFINYQFQTIQSKKKIENITTGNTIKHILASDLRNLSVSMPVYSEEEKIGSFFQQLDSFITLHQRNLDRLNKLKKGLLQQMFI